MKPASVVLPGVDRYRVNEAMFEGLRVVLTHRGEPYSPAYVQGVSGAAFVAAGPCPCAPTCGHDTDPAALARLFGYAVEEMPLWGDGVDAEAVLPVAVDRIKEEVRQGRPALVWNAFTSAEWDVVCGYDDASGVFLGRGSYRGLDEYAQADQDRTLTGCDGYPALGAILLGDRVKEYDAASVETAALQRAVMHGRTPEDRLPEDAWRSGEVGDWRFRKGIGCYEWWIGSLLAKPARLPNSGDRYCLGIYQSTRRAAAEFCLEMAEKHQPAEASLRAAAEHFSAEAEALEHCREVLCPEWQIPTQADAERNRRAADRLQSARDGYARGIDAIERAVEALA